MVNGPTCWYLHVPIAPTKNTVDCIKTHLYILDEEDIPADLLEKLKGAYYGKEDISYVWTGSDAARNSILEWCFSHPNQQKWAWEESVRAGNAQYRITHSCDELALANCFRELKKQGLALLVQNLDKVSIQDYGRHITLGFSGRITPVYAENEKGEEISTKFYQECLLEFFKRTAQDNHYETSR